MLLQYLFYILIFIFTFGQLDRIDLINGIVLHLSDVAVFVVVIYWLIQTVIRQQYKNSSQHFLFKPVLLFIAACLVSLLINSLRLQTTQLAVASLYLIRWAFYAALFFIVREFLPQVKKRVLILLIVSQFILLTIGFIQYALYPNLRNLYYLGWDDHLYRLFSTFLDPNFAAVQFNLFFFLLLSLFLASDSLLVKKKILTVVGLILAFLALLLTYSRAGYLMFFVGNIIILWLYHRTKMIGLLIGILAVGIIALPKNLHSSGVELWRTASISARSESAQQALVIIKDHPIFGIGFDAYRYAQKQYKFIKDKTWETDHSGAGTDNSFLFVLATTGIIGLATYIFLFFTITKTLVFNYLKGNKQGSGIIVALLASIAGLVVNSLFLNSLYYPYTMFWLWVLMGLSQNQLTKKS
jgi:O-antigen ligase